jgi:MbtH protein
MSSGFVVVVNDEEQYSVWADGRGLPDGWSPVGFAGSREECLAHIDTVWTDMRPASLRRALDQR